MPLNCTFTIVNYDRKTFTVHATEKNEKPHNSFFRETNAGKVRNNKLRKKGKKVLKKKISPFSQFWPGASTIKHYGFVMYGFCSKLVCLPKPVELTDSSNKTLAYHRICLFPRHFKSENGQICSKLVCLSKPVEMTGNSKKTLAYYGLCQSLIYIKLTDYIIG